MLSVIKMVRVKISHCCGLNGPSSVKKLNLQIHITSLQRVRAGYEDTISGYINAFKGEKDRPS